MKQGTSAVYSRDGTLIQAYYRIRVFVDCDKVREDVVKIEHGTGRGRGEWLMARLHRTVDEMKRDFKPVTSGNVSSIAQPVISAEWEKV